MLILAIDTSTWSGSIGIFDDKKGIICEHSLVSTQTHSERLLGTIDLILKQSNLKISDIDIFVTTIGPGSFTGLRIGVATIKGLAYANKKKVVGVSTLKVLAIALPFTSHVICPLIDARKQEVFTSLYRWRKNQLESLIPETVIKPETLILKIKEHNIDTIFVGNGIDLWGSMIKERLDDKAHFAPLAFACPRAILAATIALEYIKEGKLSEPGEIIPKYIRLSDAELNFNINAK